MDGFDFMYLDKITKTQKMLNTFKKKMSALLKSKIFTKMKKKRNWNKTIIHVTDTLLKSVLFSVLIFFI